MKKLLIAAAAVMALSTSVYAFEEITAPAENSAPVEQIQKVQSPQQEIDFIWSELSESSRFEQVNNYKSLIFSDNSKIKLTKDEFNKVFSKYKKDRDFKHHYMLTNNGVTEDEDAKYNPFYYKKDTLVIYAIQYKNDIHNSLYYTAYGKLYYVDITSENYPNFPYYSMQYDRKGNLKSVIYFVSKDIQYMYNSQEEFTGVWYKDKMFDITGKEISKRENW